MECTLQGYSVQGVSLNRRLRAAIQLMNQKFAEEVCVNGNKYHIHGIEEITSSTQQADTEPPSERTVQPTDVCGVGCGACLDPKGQTVATRYGEVTSGREQAVGI